MVSKNKKGLEIDLQKLLLAYLSRWWLIAGMAVLAAAVFLYYTVYCITPLYKASVKIYVNNIRAEQKVEYITGNNLAAAQQLVKTYVTIIRSDTVLEKVAEESGMDITAGQIRGAMSAQQVDETEVFTVTITHADPQMAADLANAIAEVAPDAIAEFVEGSSTKIIDRAKVPTSRSYPSRSRNTILGGMVGGAIAVLYVTLRFLMDVRIKDEEDLVAMFDLPVLANIPSFTPENEKYVEKRAGNNEVANGKKGGAR